MAVFITQNGRTFQIYGPTLPPKKLKQLDTTVRDRTLQVAGGDTIIPINYGRVSVPGIIGPVATDSGGNLTIGVIWGLGLHEEIEAVYVNDDSAIGATRTDYLGSSFQPVDPDLAAAISGFDDNFVLSTPAGDIGLCYSVFTFAPGDIGGAPRFQAVVKGRRYDWPENQGADDALYASTESTLIVGNTTVEDSSKNGATVTVDPTVTVDEGLATNSAQNKGIEVAQAINLGTGDFCMEANVQVSFTGASNTYFDIARGGSSFIWRINNEAVEVSIADGTPGNFVIDVAAYTLPQDDREYNLKLFRRAGVFSLEVDGVEEWTDTPGSNPNIPSASSYRTCYSESATVNVNSLRTLRITVGDDRYAAEQNAGGLPFSDSVRYTANPAVHFADLVRNPVYGLGRSISNLSEAESWCNAVVDSDPRAECHLSITRPRPVDDLLSLMGTYAQCLFYYDAGTVFILPDQQVPESAQFTETRWLEGSLQISGLDSGNAPSRVNVRYTKPESGTALWGQAVATADQAGVNSGEVQLQSTTLYLSGIQSEEQARLQAQTQVARYLNRVEASFVLADLAVRYRPGDVVNVVDSNYGVSIAIRVTQIEMVSPGRHRITGTRYDPGHYPTQFSNPVTGTIPLNAIVINSRGAPPTGWQTYALANGDHIIGAGGSLPIGATGGSATFAGFSGNTSAEDSHGDAAFETFAGESFRSGTSLEAKSEPFRAPDLTHSHSYSTGSFAPDPLTRNVKLMIKTGSTATKFPMAAQVFGIDGLLSTQFSRIITGAGRLIAAASEASNSGVAAKFVSFTSNTAFDSHDHAQSPLVNADPAAAPASTAFAVNNGGGSHEHDYNLQVRTNLKRCKLPLYGSFDEFDVVPGMIILWTGSLGSLPTNWDLCDGSNGTPDLRDHFIEIAGLGEELESVGDNSITIEGAGSVVSHQHKGGSVVTTEFTQQFAHSNDVGHSHTISNSGTWRPPYYALAALMFNP